MSIANRNFKSSVFTHLFGVPENERELYNAIAPGRFPLDAKVEDVTLKNVLYMDRVNDLSFTIENKLVVLFEHQSSINENMPLRDLIYCARVYELIISNDMLYSEKRVNIPTPEFYVLYNGKKEFQEKAVYRLSDSFALPWEGEPALELVVNVFNVNKGYNVDLVKRSETLNGYVTFVALVRRNEEKGLDRATAIEEAIKECIKLGMLVEYLEKYASEVLNMLMGEWNWDDARAVWEKEAEARGEAQSDAKWQSVLADKDATIAKLQALLGAQT